MITSLYVGKIELALDSTVICLLEVEELMIQLSRVATFDRALMVAKPLRHTTRRKVEETITW